VCCSFSSSSARGIRRGPSSRASGLLGGIGFTASLRNGTSGIVIKRTVLRNTENHVEGTTAPRSPFFECGRIQQPHHTRLPDRHALTAAAPEYCAVADPILLTDRAGYVLYGEGETYRGAIQQCGNFPCPTNMLAPGQPTPEESYRRGYTLDGCFYFRGYDVSAGQQVVFDLAQGRWGAYATNVRVP
jgi:hypothetical protein